MRPCGKFFGLNGWFIIASWLLQLDITNQENPEAEVVEDLRKFFTFERYLPCYYQYYHLTTDECIARFNVERVPVSASGFSSGGTMAMQLQVAFSRNFVGSAAFSSSK